jgi:hypothetical protein
VGVITAKHSHEEKWKVISASADVSADALGEQLTAGGVKQILEVIRL